MRRRKISKGLPAAAGPDTPLASAKRKFCNFARVWRSCGSAACRRAHDCRGDAEACFARLWAAQSEEEKVWFRTLIKTYHDRRDARAALKEAAAEVERYREWAARYQTPSEAPSEAAAPPPRTPAPRLRGL